jgi:hypothetical protein
LTRHARDILRKYRREKQARSWKLHTVNYSNAKIKQLIIYGNRMSHPRLKFKALAFCAAVACALIVSNAWSSSGVAYSSAMSQLFSNELGDFGYDTGVRSIQLVCNTPGAIVNAHVTVQSSLTSFTKVIEGTTQCSETGVLVDATSYGRRWYSVETRHAYADAMVLREWRHALSQVFGSLQHSEDASVSVNQVTRDALLAEEVNDIEFTCPGGGTVYHYAAKSKGATVAGNTTTPCTPDAEEGRVLALLTRGSERLLLSHDVRDGLLVSGLTDEYRALLTKQVRTEDMAQLTNAVAEIIHTRYSF